MKTASIIAIGAAMAVLGFGVYLINTEQTQEASMPDIDVSVEGGNLPDLEAEVGEVTVGSEAVTMEIPTIDIQAPAENRSSDS